MNNFLMRASTNAPKTDSMQIFIDAVSNTALWAAIVSCLLIISLGYVLTKSKYVKIEWKDALMGIVMKVGVPALILKSFMTPTSVEQMNNYGVVLGLAFLFYFLGCIAYVVYEKFGWHILHKKTILSFKTNSSNSYVLQEKKDNSLVFWMGLIFGSTAFFGYPIIGVLYGDSGTLSITFWNIPLLVFLFTFCYLKFKNIKFDKTNIEQMLKTVFLNPITLTTLIGFILYLTQLIPGANWKINGVETGWFDLGTHAPYIHKPLVLLAGLCTPLMWFAIGMIITESNIKTLLKDKSAWFFTLIKQAIIPLVVFGIITAIAASNPSTLSLSSAMTIIILATTPPTAIIIGYAAAEKKGIKLAASSCALSTIATIPAIPVWIIIGEVVLRSLGVV